MFKTKKHSYYQIIYFIAKTMLFLIVFLKYYCFHLSMLSKHFNVFVSFVYSSLSQLYNKHSYWICAYWHFYVLLNFKTYFFCNIWHLIYGVFYYQTDKLSGSVHSTTMIQNHLAMQRRKCRICELLYKKKKQRKRTELARH